MKTLESQNRRRLERKHYPACRPAVKREQQMTLQFYLHLSTPTPNVITDFFSESLRVTCYPDICHFIRTDEREETRPRPHTTMARGAFTSVLSAIVGHWGPALESIRPSRQVLIVRFNPFMRISSESGCRRTHPRQSLPHTCCHFNTSIFMPTRNVASE